MDYKLRYGGFVTHLCLSSVHSVNENKNSLYWGRAKGTKSRKIKNFREDRCMQFSETVTADGGKMINILFSNINVENKKMFVIFIFIVSNVKKWILHYPQCNIEQNGGKVSVILLLHIQRRV